MASKSVDTAPYQISHLKAPRGRGLWIFEDADGHQHTHTGTYGQAVKSLPAGEWKVLP